MNKPNNNFKLSVRDINSNYKYDSNNLYIWNGTEWRSTPILSTEGNYATLKNHDIKFKLTGDVK